jgi:hypothetical protein
MDWEMLGALAETLGGLGVIASMVFVGYQLRQQSNIERAKAQRDLLMQIREWVSLPSRSKEHFVAIQTCLDDFDSADDWSRQQFWDWATNVLLVFESVLYMKSDEFIHEGSYIRFEQLVLAISRTRGGAQWWKYMYDVIGTDVAEHIDARIEEVGDLIPPWNELLPHFKFAGEKPREAQPA